MEEDVLIVVPKQKDNATLRIFYKSIIFSPMLWEEIMKSKTYVFFVRTIISTENKNVTSDTSLNSEEAPRTLSKV